MREVPKEFFTKNSMWVKHPEYPGYLFSPEGNCFSERQGRNKFRKPQMRAGYPYFCLLNNGKKTQVHLHRILAELFLEKEPGKTHVNHKNGIRTDNRLENLEWCTHQENRLHACRVLDKGRGSQNGNSVLNEKQVKEIKKLLASGNSLRSIAKLFGVAKGTISFIKQGKTWSQVLGG